MHSIPGIRFSNTPIFFVYVKFSFGFELCSVTDDAEQYIILNNCSQFKGLFKFIDILFGLNSLFTLLLLRISTQESPKDPFLTDPTRVMTKFLAYHFECSPAVCVCCVYLVSSAQHSVPVLCSSSLLHFIAM